MKWQSKNPPPFQAHLQRGGLAAVLTLLCVAAAGQEGCTPEPIPYCAQAAGGAVAEGSWLSLSQAHGAIRYFGDAATLNDADRALVEALKRGTPDLQAYAEAHAGVCAVAGAETPTLAPAEVRLEGNLAFIKPGSGHIELPAGVEGIVLDLRGLPEVEGLREALDRAASLALAQAIARPQRMVRRHDGLSDAVFARFSVYDNSVIREVQSPIPAANLGAPALAILTGGPMPAEAVLLAGTLRLEGRAWIMGESLWSAVAESRYSPTTEGGLLWRYSELRNGQNRWADRILADFESDTPEDIALGLLNLGPIPAAQVEGDERPTLEAFQPYSDTQAAGQSLAEMQAALLTVHGTLKSFFPYFETIGGDKTDARLIETLSSAQELAVDGQLGRVDMLNLLRRFGESIADGHQFVWDVSGYSEGVGYLPVGLDRVDEAPVIRVSAADNLQPGDRLLTIDGESAEAWYAREYARTSSASEGYRFDLASRYLLELEAPMDLTVEGVDGQIRAEHVEPAPFQTYVDIAYPVVQRTDGYLADLGAPDLYYINLDGDILATAEEAIAALEAAQGAEGLVLDMRGYPGAGAYEVLNRVQLNDYTSPTFRVPTWEGPEDLAMVESSYLYQHLENPHFHGPIALIVGPASVSSAENLSTTLVHEARVTVVGRPSAATNGNITGLQLPGQFAFTFTGMEVLYPDGSTFHGVGIVPDVPIYPTAEDYAAGRDAELEAAILEL